MSLVVFSVCKLLLDSSLQAKISSWSCILPSLERDCVRLYSFKLFNSSGLSLLSISFLSGSKFLNSFLELNCFNLNTSVYSKLQRSSLFFSGDLIETFDPL